MYPYVAADVAMQAIAEGVASRPLSREEVYNLAKNDILSARAMTDALIEKGFIKQLPLSLIEKCLEEVIKEV